MDTATSIDLERGTGLRQPEVSIAMRQLKPLDWIDENEEKKPGKGRPNKVYSLKCDILLHNFDLLLKKSAKSNIDPVAVTIHGKPRSSKAVEKFG